MKRNDAVQGIYTGFGQGDTYANPNANRTVLYENMYRRILGELAMNRFEWIGLPDSVNVRYLELCLYRFALAVAFVDKRTDKLMIMQGAPSGPMNMYEDPLRYTLTGPNFQGITLREDVVVPVWANYYRTPDTDIVWTYASRLAETDRSIEINSVNARRGKVIVVDENTQLSATNMTKQIDEGSNHLRVKWDPTSAVTALDLGIDPEQYERLSVLRGRLWNEAMGLLGINNSNQDKRERLVADEVSANDDQVSNIQRVNLNAREQACEQINKKFAHVLNAPVTVRYHTQPVAVAETFLNENDER